MAAGAIEGESGRVVLELAADGVAPFGWSVSCRGRPAPQVEQDVRDLGEWAASLWGTSFVPQRGYAVDVQRLLSGDVHLSVRRGDFSAEAAVQRESTGANPRVRVYGRARSARLDRADRDAQRLATRGRWLGVAAGVSLLVALGWVAMGVSDPVFVLGGLLMVVAMVVSTTAGAAIGGSCGDRLGERRRRRARGVLARDPAIEADLRRFRAVERGLMAQRAALLGARATTPFRRDPDRLAG